MSVVGGEAENLCSARVFRLLTQRGNAVLFAKLRNGCFRNTNAIDEADVARPSLKGKPPVRAVCRSVSAQAT
jgi:hypothetical protein